MGDLTKYREGGSSVPKYVDNLGQRLAFYGIQAKSDQPKTFAIWLFTNKRLLTLIYGDDKQ